MRRSAVQTSSEADEKGLRGAKESEKQGQEVFNASLLSPFSVCLCRSAFVFTWNIIVQDNPLC